MARARRIAAALLTSAFLGSTVAIAQPRPQNDNRNQAPAPSSFPWEGEVTGTNVRVRSGAGTQWYATTKLNTGDRVLVVGETSGWYQIVPPVNSFSYVDISHVDAKDGASSGTIKEERAPVRAGSELASSKGTTQAWLTKGARVDILGKVDGFYKIRPPAGAVLYITKDYVKPVAQNMRSGLAERYAAAQAPSASPPVQRPTAPPPTQPRVTSNTPTTPDANSTIDPSESLPEGEDLGRINEPAEEENGTMEGAEPSTTPDFGDADDSPPLEAAPSIQSLKNRETPTTSVKPAELQPAPESKASGRYQALLTTVESDLASTMQLPLAERDFESLLTRYQEIANQTEERVPAEYARIRIGQIQTLADLRKTRAEVVATSTEIDTFKARMTTERMKIMRARAEKVTEKFDFVGELRKSYAFAPEKRRFRLVDPKRQTTIAYIDIPRDVNENVDFMVGRTVGIRTSGQRYSMAARIPIAVAASITDLTPSRETPTTEMPANGDPSAPVELMPPPLDEPVDDEPASSPEPASPRNSAARPVQDNTTARAGQ